MSGDLYEVAIVGAGPAGATAAICLAQKGRRVVLVDRATFPQETLCTGWLSARTASLLNELGVPDKTLLDREFRDVTFYPADFLKSVKPAFQEAPGYLIDRTRFGNALVSTAVDHGVTFIQGCAAVGLQLKESSTVVELADGRQVEGKLLVLASGRGSKLLESVALSPGTGESLMWTAQVDAYTSRDVQLSALSHQPSAQTSLPGADSGRLTADGSGAAAVPRVAVILGLDTRGSFGLCCLLPDRVSIAVNWIGDGTSRDRKRAESEAIPELANLCRQAYEHKVVPVDLTGQARSAKLVPSPASTALDMDSHVGKHTLAIGDAGGFVSAASNESIYPGMWSAQIAAGVLDRALESIHSQDELMTFDAMWRMRMADYLRSPHTDIQFLLPLIFSNQPMADRMGAAFFFGENI